MPQLASSLPRRHTPHQAGLTVRQRLLPWHAVLPFLRGLAALGLIVALIGGLLNWLWYTPDVGALEFTSHTISTGVTAVGVQGITTHDLDGDDDIDIITAGLDGLKIYENQGQFNYRIHTVSDVDAERVQVVDLDNDDDSDLLVTLKNTTNIVRWYRKADGLEFGSGINIVTSGKNAVAYAGDLNADGAMDVATARDESGAVTLSRWMNDGSGTFVETVLDSDSQVTAITTGDTDGNGYADIVIGGPNGLQVWRTGDGSTFTRSDIDDTKANRTHLAMADPEDGSTWIVTADVNDNVAAIYRSRTDGSYGRLELPLSVDAKTVAPIDLDEDGDLDILVAGQDDNAVFWYDNDGQDHFTQRTVATNLQSVYGVAAADLDGDSDIDFVAGDHFRGAVYAYERVRAKPTATSATDVAQSTAGTGIVTFTTTVADGDFDPTRLRIQYTVNGTTWEKPYLTKVTASAGTVDLKNSNAYQVGTSNGIDTSTNSEVTLTLTWDTKSVQNTGGPITGDPGTVQLRIIPRDDKSVGDTATSGKFRIDNRVPQGLGNVTLTSLDTEQMMLTWDRASDASAMTYQVYYGTDTTAVLEQRSAVWDNDNDVDLNDTEATTTTVTGLTADTTYTFKVVATDAYGNSSAAPSVRGATSSTSESTSTPASPAPSPSGALAEPGFTPFPSSDPAVTPSPDPFATPVFSPSPTSPLFASPAVTPSPARQSVNNPLSARVPSVLQDNRAPVADAGPDQVVNPQALVILDATASTDADRDSMTFTWRQLAGSRVELQSDRTATPSFSAGEIGGTYVFAVTVRDAQGATATDTVTVATKSLPPGSQTAVSVDGSGSTTGGDIKERVAASPLVTRLLHPANVILFSLALLSTVILLVERVVQSTGQRPAGPRQLVVVPGAANQPQGRVVHYKTGEPIAGAQVLIYGSDGKLRATERTSQQGVFGTFFPVGQYTLGVQAEGFSFAPTAARSITPAGGMLYTGGTLTVRDGNRALAIVIPMKPAAAEVTSFRARLMHTWQTMQHLGRVLSWPLFLAGAMLNTTLVFLAPGPLYLALEVLYIILVVIKIVLEVRVRPAYGQVRDAITHVPLDLAVVRLFDQKSNRLVMTRVTNNQGKFFALPPAGLYTVTVSKPGYVTFTKQSVEIQSEHDSTLQMTADLMPVVPNAGRLQQPRPVAA